MTEPVEVGRPADGKGIDYDQDNRPKAKLAAPAPAVDVPTVEVIEPVVEPPL